MKHSFTWANFSDDFRKAVVYSNKTQRKPICEAANLIPFMDMISRVPNLDFVKTYKEEIEEYFLKDSFELEIIAKKLAEKNYKNIDMKNRETMLMSLKRKRYTETIGKMYVDVLKKHGSRIEVADISDTLFFSTPLNVNLSETEASEIELRQYQEDALSKMRKFFIEDGRKEGILKAATGSGKTRIATAFMLQDMVSAGYQIIWLANRSLLLEQAADCVLAHSSAVKVNAPEKKNLRMACVSGKHSSIRRCDADDDVIIASVQSLVRNKDYLKGVVRDKVLIVVDEMHHSTAPSYRTVIKAIRDIARESKLLGLSATPVRINDAGTKNLMKLYGDNIICDIDAAELIKMGYLSKPIVERMATNINIDTIITLDEEKYIMKWGELPESLMEKMADLKERNEVIVSKYIDNKEEYGKTLIFALNASHCISLSEEFQKRGIKADYIYSAHQGNEEKIQKFKAGELDVLININMLTEGADVPNIQSVFLTRPTSSDVLLMQMIGRGMRGTASGGTETVNIIDFYDQWDRAHIWLNAMEIITGDTPEEPAVDNGEYRRTELIDWARFRDILDGISTRIASGNLNGYVSTPSGWYDVVDKDGNDTAVMVFESQLEGYTELWKNRHKFMDNLEYTGDKALKDFFDYDGLMPISNELEMVMNTARGLGSMLHLFAFENRKSVDAASIADAIKEKDLRISEIDEFIKSAYEKNEKIADSIYGSFEAFSERVMDFLKYPDGIKPLGAKIEEMPMEEIPYEIDGAYDDLETLMKEVVEERFNGVYGNMPLISWTKRPIKGYFGRYYYKEIPKIVVNKALNSSQVDREVIKFIIYHELLHRDNRYHDKKFYAEEHKYPEYYKHNMFLDGTFLKYKAKYAM